MKSGLWRATVILIGTTIGAGMFGIPYVIAKIGLGLGLLYLLALTLLTLGLNIAYSEVILRVGKGYQLSGYAEVFFGRGGQIFGALTLLIGQVGALLAYIIGVGDFLAVIFNVPSKGVLFSIAFFLVASGVAYLGIRLVVDLEGLISFAMISLILFLVVFSLPKIQLSNFVFAPSSAKTIVELFVIPLGVVFSALAGYAVIPEMAEILKGTRKKLFSAVVAGTLIPSAAYLIFTLGVVGISGKLTSPAAIAGLAAFLPAWIVKLGAVFGVLAMTSSFLTLTLVLYELFNKDLKIPKNISWGLSTWMPFALFLLGAQSFIGVLSVTGLAMGILNTGLIIGMYVKSSKLKILARL